MIFWTGPYYFTGTFGKKAIGGKGRVGINFLDYLTGEVRASYDNLFHFNIQGDVKLRIPFGPKSKSQRQKSNVSASSSCAMDQSIMKRMVRPVERQEIVVLSEQSKEERAGDFYSSNDLTFYHVNNLSTAVGDGTFEDPFSVLASAQTISQPNQVIYVNAGNNLTTNQDAGFTLKDNQMLFSTGTDHMVRSAQGFVPVPALTEGRLPSIDSPGDGITLENNNIVEGFMLSGVGDNGFFATDQPIASAILRNQIVDPTNEGILIEYTAAFSGNVDGTWAVNGNFITTSGGGDEGIMMTTTDSGTLATNIEFLNNEIINTSSDSIHFVRTSGAAVWNLTGKINGNTLDGSGGEAVFFEGSTGAAVTPINFGLTVNDNRIINNAADGIQMLRGTGFMDISGNTISANGGTAGIFLQLEESDVFRASVNYNFLSDQADTTHFETNDSSLMIMDFIGNTTVNGAITFDVNAGTGSMQVRMKDNSGVVDFQGNVTLLP